MATILVYNQDTNKIERYNRGPNEAMPYVTGNTLTVKEFRGSSGSDIMWTTKAFMEAWNSFRRQWGKPIYVGYAFKRIWQGGHSGMSQHYAGLAMDMAQTFSNSERNRLRELAIDSRLFTYVEPKALTPTWVMVLLEEKKYCIKKLCLKCNFYNFKCKNCTLKLTLYIKNVIIIYVEDVYNG